MIYLMTSEARSSRACSPDAYFDTVWQFKKHHRNLSLIMASDIHIHNVLFVLLSL